MVIKKVAIKKAIPLFIAVLGLSFPAWSTGQPNVVVTPAANSTAQSKGSSEEELKPSKQAVSDAVCDPNVYERMKQKAWMEAQRENYVNQSLILKPDSLFAITCFSQQLGQTKTNLGVPEKGETASNSSETRFDKVINTVAANSTAFVGDTDKEGKVLLTPDINSNVQPVTAEKYDAAPKKGADFKCNEMKKLWQQAQCGNFAAGDLPSLAEVGGPKEARNHYPANACTVGKDDQTKGNTLFTYARATADVQKPMANLPNATNTDTNPCYKEAFNKLAGFDCKTQSGQDDACWPGKQGTGTVVASDRKAYPAISCSNPGCTPQPSGGVLKCKQQK